MNKSFAILDQDNKGNYIELLLAMFKLSKLFSESTTPFINYRAAENIFCRAFNAENLARSDVAFDAKIGNLGIGLKTFICQNNGSTEKVAEFNRMSNHLKVLNNKELAEQLAVLRNERINFAKRMYGIDDALYHIVSRRKNEVVLFETDYNEIDLDSIHEIKSKDASLEFSDKYNKYIFNRSKSTLFRKFIIPNEAFSLPVTMLSDPYDYLLDLFKSDFKLSEVVSEPLIERSYVILPLYGRKRFVYEKSGLNQWNASGRARDYGEVYIPVPKKVHEIYPDFFPAMNETFNLITPRKEVLEVKLCQENSKALMSNPNKGLSNWLLRDLLQLKEGELATIEKLDALGFDSVIITKNRDCFSIDKAPFGAYEKFIEDQERDK